ncbi:peroxiredoxin [Maribellus maritimus]|uniref:peroxiredoxin n=1 Tax=Maribellus maritimus TaxID=2870838 RepID=UPI001EEC4964|nr:peroxiredoxin [Maribellus maritimus]MCG6188977.1 peroxiredoxin [Maribellus maritimus]
MKRLAISSLIVLFVITSRAKDGKLPLIGDKAPSFKENTTNGMLNFPEDFGKSWKILFSHPLDFTPVCTSELCALAYEQEKLDSLGIKIAVVSIDEVERHLLWKEFIERILKDNSGRVKINFPIVADLSGKISKKYGMLHSSVNDSRDVRGVFIIDPDNVVQAINFYPMSVGRSIDEIIRTVTALQLTQKENVLTPANWNPGDDVLIPHRPYSIEELKENPELENQFYNVGEFMWFKKMNK